MKFNEGRWADRLRVHREANAALKAAVHANDDPPPKLLIVAGPSSIGKSEIIKRLRKDEDEDPIRKAMKLDDDQCQMSIVIGPDLIKSLDKKPAPVHPHGVKGPHPEWAPEKARNYTIIRNRLVMEALDAGVSVILDDHCNDVGPVRINEKSNGDDLATISGLLWQVRQSHRDVKVELLGITTDGDSYKNRLAPKIANGKMKISSPEFQFVLGRARNFFANIHRMTSMVDHTVVVDNHFETDPKNAAYQPVVINEFATRDGIKGIRKVGYDMDNYARYVASMNGLSEGSIIAAAAAIASVTHQKPDVAHVLLGRVNSEKDPEKGGGSSLG